MAERPSDTETSQDPPEPDETPDASPPRRSAWRELPVLLLIAVRNSAHPQHLQPEGMRDRHTSLRTRDVPVLGAVGLGDALANAAFAQASTGGLLSIVSVLGSLYPVATLVLARVFLKERLLSIQLKGVTVALLGIVMIGVGGGTG